MVVEGPKVAFQDRRFPATSGRGVGAAKIFAYGKRLYPHRMLLHGTSDLDQRCLKTHYSENECTFPRSIFAPSPKITQNPILGNLSMQNLAIIQTALCKSDVNRATKPKLYSYIGIGKYLGCVKIFPLVQM